ALNHSGSGSRLRSRRGRLQRGKIDAVRMAGVERAQACTASPPRTHLLSFVIRSTARSESAPTHWRSTMTMRPDPTFHASPKLAMEAPPENFAYTLLLSPDFSQPDALAVIDTKPGTPTSARSFTQ